jgi:tetratricopeptide (TPR) repeat protein
MTPCRALIAIIAATAAAAAAAAGAGQPEPTLKDLKRAPPDIRSGERVQPDAARARGLYQEFLDLQAGDPALRNEALRRLGDLQLEAGDAERGETPAPGAGSAQTQAAIAMYTRLLQEQPDFPRTDAVLYQLSRAWEAEGDPVRALGYLDELVARFPASRRIDEAHFRRGEILFVAKRYAAAQSAYEAVIAIGEGSEFHEQSLYKLGWSLFKQSENEAAVDPFVRLLDLKLVTRTDPPGLVDPAALAPADRELVQDTFRVLSIGFSYLDGAASLDKYLAGHAELPYAYRLYSELGDLYVSKERYTDAADTYRAFVSRSPDHERAPLLQMQAIDAYRRGGFGQLVLEGKKEFVQRYRLGSSYWAARRPDEQPLVVKELKANLTDLARYYHAEAQRSKRAADYQEAARWYGEFLQSFPDDPAAAATRFLLADTLFESQQYRAAALEYERTAYDYPAHEKSATAGYAALVAYERHGAELNGDALAAWQRQRLESQLRFATAFPAHPESAALLTRTAREYYDLREPQRAIDVAGLALARLPPVEPAMQRVAWTVIGNAQFDTGHFAEAEGAYLQVQSLLTDKDAEAGAITERLAASIYRQGEFRRDSGDPAGAVDDFLRVGRLAPGSTIRETAEFDAAALLVSLEDWQRAIEVLEGFRRAYPTSPRQGDVTRNLALAYLEAGRPGEAAGEFERIANAAGETPEVQREALWQAGELYEKSGQVPKADASYEALVRRFPMPLDQAMEARLKLAEHARDAGDASRRRMMLESIVQADGSAGAARTDRSRYLAAHAALELAAPARDAFNSIRLVAPLKRTLADKKVAMEQALKGYQAAIDYGVAEATTAATYETGELYRRLGEDLLKSERPKDLDADELEQYDLLLEEQAYPFEEKAAAIHGLNTARPAEGIYDQWVQGSYAVLALLEPARFGKTEEHEPFIAELQPATPAVPEPATGPIAVAVSAPAAAPAIPEAASQRFDEAVRLLESGQFRAAQPALEELMAGDGSYAAPAVNLGIMHAREQHWPEAEAALAEGLKRDPGSAVAQNELGAVYRGSGRFEDAEGAYRQALALAPDHALAHRNLGVLLDLYLGRPGEALQHFEAYQSLAGADDKQVSGWIAELKRRVASDAQTARTEP